LGDGLPGLIHIGENQRQVHEVGVLGQGGLVRTGAFIKHQRPYFNKDPVRVNAVGQQAPQQPQFP
jgi:hypothetical protein